MGDVVYRSRSTLTETDHSISQALFITVIAVVTLLLFFIHEQTAPVQKQNSQEQVMTPVEFSFSERS